MPLTLHVLFLLFSALLKKKMNRSSLNCPVRDLIYKVGFTVKQEATTILEDSAAS